AREGRERSPSSTPSRVRLSSPVRNAGTSNRVPLTVTAVPSRSSGASGLAHRRVHGATVGLLGRPEALSRPGASRPLPAPADALDEVSGPPRRPGRLLG